MYWFGRPISDRRLGTLFTDFLTGGTTPFWVTDFARKAKVKFEAGELDPAAYGIKNKPQTLLDKSIGRLFSILLVVLMLAFSYIVTMLTR